MTRFSFPYFVLVVALVSGCTRGIDIEEVSGPGDPVSAIEATTTDENIADVELRYRCGSVVFTPAEFAAMAEVTDEGLGILTAVDGREYKVDPTPIDVGLPGVPLALMVADSAGPAPCVAVNAAVSDLRPVAWELVEGAVVVERCVEPDELVTDRRDVDGVAVLSFYAPPTDLDADCSLDLDAPLAIDVDADVRSGLVFPFGEPSAQIHQALGFGSAVAVLDPAVNTDVTCSTQAVDGEVLVTWTPLEPGFVAEITADDEVLFRSEAAGVTDSPSLVAASNERLLSYGLEPDATVRLQSFGDYRARVGATRAYSLGIASVGPPTVAIPCGEAGINSTEVPDPEPIPITNTIGGNIGAAADQFEQVAVLPFVYMTVVPLCISCSGDSVSLQMSPDGNRRIFVPPLVEQTDPNQPGLINPFSLHQMLADAEANGRDVSYTFDQASGVPVEWMIDGEGARILCLELDLAPPDLRPASGCRTELDLIGG